MRIFINGRPHQTDLASMSYERLMLTLGQPTQSVMTVTYSARLPNGSKAEDSVVPGRFFQLYPNMVINAINTSNA
jgi:hypothetical protein